MRISLRQLETFRIFAHTMSVTETARLTSVSQSAVSHTLRQLESEVGVKLFFRSGNHLRLTSEGKALLPAMERVFAQLSSFEEQAEAARTMGGGRLSISSVASIGHWLINEAIARFLADKPRIRFTFQTGTAAEVLDQVRGEMADIGFTMLANDDAGIFLEPLLKSEVICALPLDHRLAANETVAAPDLHHERLIVPGPTTVVGTRLSEIFPVERMRRLDVLEINQSAVAVDLAARGAGVALVHPFGMPIWREGVAFRRFLPSTELRLMMVFPRNRPVARLVTRFAEDVHKVAGAMSDRFAATGLSMVHE